MKAVILAGGKGTRLQPYTRIFPKSLVPIGDRPIMEILLLQLHRAGFNQIYLAVGHMDKLIRAYFQDGAQWKVNIYYSKETHALGTAGPLSLIDGLDKTFLVANSDILTTLPIDKLVEFHKEEGAIATIAMHRREVKIDLGVIKLDGDKSVVDYIEKPSTSYLVSMGMYVFEPRVLQYIPAGEHLDFPELIKKLLAAGETVSGYPFDGYWQDLGHPADYEQAQQDFDVMKDQFLPEEV